MAHAQRLDQAPVNGSYREIYGDPTTFTAAERDAEWGMISPVQSCGNFYYAPDGNELEFVFDDIASRMFTRLAR